jgi:NADH-quinone oxidoreductase subunit N
MFITVPSIDWSAIGALLIMAGTGLVVLVEGMFVRSIRVSMVTAIAGLGAAAVYSIAQRGAQISGFGGMILIDNLSLLFYIIILAGAFLSVLLLNEFVESHPEIHGEVLALFCFSVFGMMLMASAGDLVIVFLGIEIVSISLYILAGIRRSNPYSLEAAFKYFLIGAFASGFLLFGIAYIFGATGSTNFERILSFITNSPDGPSTFLYIGVFFLLVGFGFKIAVVPFHMWVPDVYEGSPTPIVAFMSTGVKAAGFAVLIRVFLHILGGYFIEWRNILWVLAVLTMTTGNLIALVQDNIKRMLAYSSIAHAGYMLVGFTAGSPVGISSVIYYVAAYTVMNIGAFGIISYFESEEKGLYTISEYSGLRYSRPWLAAGMALFLFALAGIPPTAGFFAKFYVFRAAVNSNLTGLAVIGALNAVLSVYYYLRVIIYMYMRPAEKDFSDYTFRMSDSITLVICAVIVLIFGLFPSLFLGIAEISVF